MSIFEKILDSIYPVVLALLVPLMIYGFFGVTSEYKEINSNPSSVDLYVARDKAMIKKGIKKIEQIRKEATLKKKHPPPPQLYRPGNNDFNIPLQQLLEGNHGRLL